MNFMKKYVKKPIPIHAFRWDGSSETLIYNMAMKDIQKYIVNEDNDVPDGRGHIAIKSLEGVEKCPIGDYIIRGIHGEYYPCDPKIFKESYKEVK